MLCFVHVPKAAGTTVNFVFRRSLGHRFMELEPWVDIRRVISPADLELLHRWSPWIRHISSHYVRAYSGLERVSPNIRYMTFLRDPINRYISEYFHFRYKNCRVANFQEFLSNRIWANKQTKFIAGTDDVAAAQQLLDEKFAFVGLVESMDESLVLMRQVFSELRLDVGYGSPKNLARQGPAQQELYDNWPAYEDRVMENNARDIELYAYARDSVFARQRQDYGPQLVADVAELQETNRPARKRQWSYLASRAHYKCLLAYYRKRAKRKWPIDNQSLSAEYDFFGEYVF